MERVPGALALIRIPWDYAKEIGKNPHIPYSFKSVIYVTVDEPPKKDLPFSSAHVQGNVHESRLEETRKFLSGILGRGDVTHAIISQPLFWYSRIAEEVCLANDIKVVWFEGFPGGKGVFDTIGCQYTRESELLTYGPRARLRFPEIPNSTRAGQPEYLHPHRLLQRYDVVERNTLILFGQSHIDMSLVDTEERMKYTDWMRAVVERNRNVTILYKPHPVYQVLTHLKDPLSSGVLDAPNVKLFDESIYAAFDTFWFFASYSSTVIMEGAFEGRIFATGGRHFLDEEKMSLRVNSKLEAFDLLKKLSAFKPSWTHVARRLGFVTRSYALPFWSDRLPGKLLLSPDQFYEEDLRL